MRRPRRASQVSIGPAMAPCSSRAVDSRSASSRPASVEGVTSAPRMTSEWPERYLVTECSTTSTPSLRGCCTSGVAKVLSHTVRAPASTRHGGEGADVGDLQHGVGGGLDPEHRRPLQRLADLLLVGGVDATDHHRAGGRELVEQCGRAVVGVRRDHDGPAVRHQGEGGRDGSHPRGEDLGVAALEAAERLLERRPGGVAPARVVDRAVGEVGRRELEGRVDSGTRHTGLAPEGDDTGGGGQLLVAHVASVGGWPCVPSGCPTNGRDTLVRDEH